MDMDIFEALKLDELIAGIRPGLLWRHRKNDRLAVALRQVTGRATCQYQYVRLSRLGNWRFGNVVTVPTKSFVRRFAEVA